MKVCVVGTGYVGLTTGVSLAFLGHDVTCVDLDEAKVAMLAAGRSPIYEPHLEALLGEAAERLRFTTEYAVGVPDADVVFIAVQTPSLREDSFTKTQTRRHPARPGASARGVRWV